MRHFLLCFFLCFQSFSAFSAKNAVSVNVAGEVYVFHKSSFVDLGLKKSVLYKTIFKRSLSKRLGVWFKGDAPEVDLTDRKGVRVQTFPSIHRAIESGESVLRGCEQNSSVSYHAYAQDIEMLGLNDRLSVPVKWHDVHTEVIDGVEYRYFVLRLFGVDFEFVEVGGVTPWFGLIHSVTQKQWEAVMKERPSFFKRFPGQEGDLPVESVSWYDAHKFLDILNHSLGVSGFGGRLSLPSESQWQTMMALNMGETWVPEDSVHFGQTWKEGRTIPVKDKKRGSLGVWMGGNVWEWTSEQTSYAHVTILGGCATNAAHEVGSQALDWSPPHYKGRYLSFRMVRAP